MIEGSRVKYSEVEPQQSNVESNKVKQTYGRMQQCQVERVDLWKRNVESSTVKQSHGKSQLARLDSWKRNVQSSRVKQSHDRVTQSFCRMQQNQEEPCIPHSTLLWVQFTLLDSALLFQNSTSLHLTLLPSTITLLHST